MLQELMTEIRRGGTLEVTSLAVKLNTTPQLVTMMLETLQMRGFLKPYETCGDGCSGCSLASACGHNDQSALQLWQFQTDIGNNKGCQAGL